MDRLLGPDILFVLRLDSRVPDSEPNNHRIPVALGRESSTTSKRESDDGCIGGIVQSLSQRTFGNAHLPFGKVCPLAAAVGTNTVQCFGLPFAHQIFHRYKEVIVVVGMNPNKKYLVSPEERRGLILDMLKNSYASKNVRVEGTSKTTHCFLVSKIGI